jgi:uncharacterized protein (TIGR00288 family)
LSPWWLRPPADEPAGQKNEEGAASSKKTIRSPERLPAERPVKGPRAGGPGRTQRRRRKGPAGERSKPPPKKTPAKRERTLALFCDLENIALGVRQSDIKRFDVALVLTHLQSLGKIVVKRAYADWERYGDLKRSFHEAGVELTDIPQKYHSGKSSADIKMAVDAIELCFAKEHLDTFVILSGDSDLTPLVSKLKENNKYVIGLGVKQATSGHLVESCDEFLYYEDLWREGQNPPELTDIATDKAEAFGLMIDAIKVLMREDKETLWGSVVKQTMQRDQPSFNEARYGYATFSELLEDAERSKIIRLKRDQRSGSYVVTGFARR